MIPEANSPGWFVVENGRDLPSPALLIYQQRVEFNLHQMIHIARGTQRLRPHIKTHKMPALLKKQLALGLTRFKCATLAEAAMAAECGAPDVLLAYQPVGPAAYQLAELVTAFPKTRFSAITDDPAALKELSAALLSLFGPLPLHPEYSIQVLVDIDLGQHRTGVPAGPAALELYRLAATLPRLQPGGLHAYDGHIGQTDLVRRTAVCEEAFEPVASLRTQLETDGLPVPRVVAGGSPTFPIHARRADVECSPGTCVFWDAGYAQKLPDLAFKPAALLLTRVVSKPGINRLCVDLGHKAVASEMPHPRVEFLNLQDAKAVLHSEEHLVLESPYAKYVKVGDCLFGMPWHICPTVALHARAYVITQGKATEVWDITARDRLARLR